jgi:acyl phosphate:glycerol-3-phosphate acyltransferase
MFAALLVIGLAFLLGSIPTGVLLSRALGGRDVRQHGSGNIGAANVVRTSGFKVGALVGLIDIVKGVAPVLIGRLGGLDDTGLAIVAVLAVVGHDYSIFLRFRGGKGVATTLGAALALAPWAAVLTMVGWLLVMYLSRYSSLASLTALALLPIILAITMQPVPYVVAGLLLFALGVWKHRANIVRLATGRESRFRRLKPSNGS